METTHVPVLADEVLDLLSPAAGSRNVDATLGGGGHAERILAASDPDGRLLGLDADGAAIASVRARLAPRFGDRMHLRQANFRELASVASSSAAGTPRPVSKRMSRGPPVRKPKPRPASASW